MYTSFLHFGLLPAHFSRLGTVIIALTFNHFNKW
jgi:hypothetical protein